MSRYRMVPGFVLAIFVATLLAPERGAAIYLDEAKLFKLTGQFYTQTRLRMQESDPPEDLRGGGTLPAVSIGQLIQWRNLAFPVFEGDLGRSLGWSMFDNLSFRFAGRFIYDGVYDFGTSQFRRSLRRHIVSANSPSPHPGLMDANGGRGLGGNEPVAIFQGTKPVERAVAPGPATTCGDPANAPFFAPPGTFACLPADQDVRAARLRDQEVFDPRDIFTQQIDPWEIYVNVEKRPLFLRIGRQNLAWGESDGQRLLDGINPLDRLFGLPFDEDLDEQRIPLWMIRSNVQLVDAWGPLSSFGVESFLVPGVIDTTQGPVPLHNDYPYAPPAGCDPQFIANEAGRDGFGGTRPPPDGEGCTRTRDGFLPRGTVQTSLYDRLPAKRWDNSRYGVRLLGILFRDYTFSLGYYHSFADVPAPLVHYTDMIVTPGCTVDDVNSPNCATPPLPTHVIAELQHKQLDVFGATISFFQPRFLPGVLRAEVGYFLQEPALVPLANQGHIPLLEDFCNINPSPDCQRVFIDTFIPDADWLRWVIGYDVFQLNVPWISPTNNIVIVSQYFSELLLSDDDEFQALAREVNVDSDLGKYDLGATRPDGSRNTLSRYHGLGNITFQAFMMHGLLVPRLTFVGDIEGWGAVLPSVEYRLRDNLLIRAGYSAIFGAFTFGGLFRDRDQIGARITWLLS